METIVTALFEPEFEAKVISEAFSENQTIQVSTTSSGVFEYQLDEGEWQDDPFFYNVYIGSHEVKVRDIRGCIENSETVVVMGYPKFFTPNGDGYNDAWNITAPVSPIDYLATAKILIFDRYGKLMKQLDPKGEGWNGTYNGVDMPSDDYWFIVGYTEPNTDLRKEFKAHFSLKR
jgi:gliding motility-associated-like protein